MIKQKPELRVSEKIYFLLHLGIDFKSIINLTGMEMDSFIRRWKMTNETILPKRSRWKLEAKTFPDLVMYTMSVQHDYFSQTIALVVLDAIVKEKPIVHEWIVKTLNNPNEEVFSLYNHDGNGNVLYKKVLKGVKLIGHKCNHNYECDGDDLQDHELLFTYNELKTVENIL